MYLRILIPILLPALSPFGAATASSELQPREGRWRITEHLWPEFGGGEVLWEYDLILTPDNRILGVGRLQDSDGDTIQGPVSVFVLEAKEDGRFAGGGLKADGRGRQFEVFLEAQVRDGGRGMVMESYVEEDEPVADLFAAWVKDTEPASSAPFESGAWVLREVVFPDHGGWDIRWAHKFYLENRGRITGTGRKEFVNGRNATFGERKTVSSIQVNLGKGGTLRGSALERNHTGKIIRADYEGWLARNGRLFLLESYEKGKPAAVLIGRRDED